MKIWSSIDMILPAVVEAPPRPLHHRLKRTFIHARGFIFLSFWAFFLAVNSDFCKLQPLR